ncbi:MAG: hypothetical protein OEU36_18740 [Gammaproteobacteria bacterium]|nr:hypothetical protein [Gammaproteobacteria bacterium]
MKNILLLLIHLQDPGHEYRDAGNHQHLQPAEPAFPFPSLSLFVVNIILGAALATVNG